MLDYVKALRSPIIERLFKIEFLEEDDRVVGERTLDVLSGTLNIQLQSNARRGCSLSFDNSRGFYTPNEDSHIWIDKKFRIWTGLLINGQEYLNLRGTFVMGNPAIASDYSSKTATITGMDKWHLLDGSLGGTLEDTFNIPSGSPIATAVQMVLTEAGDTATPIVAYTTATTPSTISKIPGGAFSEMLIELADFMAWEVFYDEEGRLRFQPPIDVATESSVWDFSAEETSYKGSSHTYEFDKIKNVVKVIGDNTNYANVIGIAEDTDIFSHFNIDKITRKSTVITDELIHTNLYAKQRAEYELSKLVALQESVAIKSIPIDIINEGEVITIDDTSCDLHRDRCQVLSISYPLRNEGEMSMTVWKERKIS